MSMRTYTVQPGDTLGIISKKIYGDTGHWQELFELNRDIMGNNPDLLKPGWVLTYKVPAEPEKPITTPTRMTEEKGKVISDLIHKFKTSRVAQAAVALPVAALVTLGILAKRRG